MCELRDSVHGAKPKTTAMLALLAAVALATSSCATPSAPTAGSRVTQPGEASARRAPLIAMVRLEPPSLGSRGLVRQVSMHLTRRMFNATLGVIDDKGTPRPELAEELPELNGENWQVFPDGRMLTRHRLRAGLTWHDGTPLGAEDFVFSWRVYSQPEHGHAGAPPMHAIEDIGAPDPRTLVIRWRALHADAVSLSSRDRDLPPLPRHLLQEAFESQSADVFASLPFWTREYVGAGPFRLDRWEPGAFIEASAFDRYVLGRPRIDRLMVLFMPDPNTALARLLSGEAHLATDDAIGQRVDALKDDWIPRGAGLLVRWPNSWRAAFFQMRPAVQDPRSLSDVRVRRALAHGVDKEAVNQAVYGGDVILSHSMIWSGSQLGAAAERGAITYPYDPRRSEQLMNEAGFVRGADGSFANTEGRFSAEVKTNQGADNEPELLALASTWRQAGFEMREAVLPSAQAQDNQVRSLFPGLYTNNINMGEPTLIGMNSESITRPENRWVGTNRGGWSSEPYDRLVDVFTRTLDHDQRVELTAQLLRILTDELPAISLFHRSQPLAYVPGLRGPAPAAPESSLIWNIHTWEFGG